MKYESMIQNRQWDALSRALQSADGFIGMAGGRYVRDAYDVHRGVDKGSHDFYALEERLFEVLCAVAQEMQPREIQSAQRVISQFRSIRAEMDEKLSGASSLASALTMHLYDLQYRPTSIDVTSSVFQQYLIFHAQPWQKVEA